MLGLANRPTPPASMKPASAHFVKNMSTGIPDSHPKTHPSLNSGHGNPRRLSRTRKYGDTLASGRRPPARDFPTPLPGKGRASSGHLGLRKASAFQASGWSLTVVTALIPGGLLHSEVPQKRRGDSRSRRLKVLKQPHRPRPPGRAARGLHRNPPKRQSTKPVSSATPSPELHSFSQEGSPKP